MRSLLSAIIAVLLLAGLGIGTMAHATERLEFGQVTAATQWLHAEGDHDQVPADADKNYPHHHTICHGHDMATPMSACAGRVATGRDMAPLPAADLALAAGPLDRTLRPPIA